MPLGLADVRDRVLAFAKEREGESPEDAEAKSSWDGFFHVFGGQSPPHRDLRRASCPPNTGRWARTWIARRSRRSTASLAWKTAACRAA
jgi:hypothetical protein